MATSYRYLSYKFKSFFQVPTVSWEKKNILQKLSTISKTSDEEEEFEEKENSFEPTVKTED